MSEQENDKKVAKTPATPEPENTKHKKTITEPIEQSALADTLGALARTIMTLGNKQQHLFNDWMETWKRYLAFEKTFDPRFLVFYNRGDIVHAQLGYNIGNELGGARYCIVVENDNNKTDGLVTIVPISSLEDGKTETDLHRSEVFLGKLIDDVECYAKTLQIRPISKLRIIKPKYKKDGKIRVPGEYLKKIDEQIILNFTQQKLSVSSKTDT